MDSALQGFYKLSVSERRKKLAELAKLDAEEVKLLEKFGALDEPTANRMIENVVGSYSLPLGIATNFKINGKDYLIPFAIEEPSVVAAASNGAKIARAGGGFRTSSDEPVMIGQIQLVGVKNENEALKLIAERRHDLLKMAEAVDPTLKKYGGGPVGLEVKKLKGPRGTLVLVHLLVNVADAMGANAVNTMCEKLAPELEQLTEGKVRLRIISNLATKRLARAEAVFPKSILGEDLIEGILDAWALAAADPYRAATHNKGTMNGIDAVVIATGNDWRAVEAGAHAYAAFNRSYEPLTCYHKNAKGDLVGEIELPLAVGIVGGATKTHPLAQLCIKLLGVKNARELAEIIAAVGLAQNFAALRALAGEGIQRGHMQLHARNIAVMAGAKGKQIDEIAKKMAEEKNVKVSRAKELLEAK
ncbi:hydroxymethylglutaryl-CoA reductase, degradative [Candidatus Micrarchaeota archaeon]|nr:MAG: hydroxymethylglutaryl-CoA reductase, degradative [Candidatus Micrarchaeota archaeon]